MTEIHRILKKDFDYRGLNGKNIIILDELTATDIINRSFDNGDWECYTFMDRRNDFYAGFNKRCFRVLAEDNFKYIVCEDEIEGEIPRVKVKNKCHIKI